MGLDGTPLNFKSWFFFRPPKFNIAIKILIITKHEKLTSGQVGTSSRARSVCRNLSTMPFLDMWSWWSWQRSQSWWSQRWWWWCEDASYADVKMTMVILFACFCPFARWRSHCWIGFGKIYKEQPGQKYANLNSDESYHGFSGPKLSWSNVHGFSSYLCSLLLNILDE